MANGNMSYFDYLYVHETGHNLGMTHDNFLNCKSGPTSLPSECIPVEYGNSFSVMGSGALGGHPSFVNKMRAGWLSAPSITEATQGTYPLNAIENPNPSFLGLDFGNDLTPNYAFEKRSAVGVDTPNLFPDVSLEGALVYRMVPDFGFAGVSASPFSWSMSLVDTTPAQASTSWAVSLRNSTLKIPQSFSDTGLSLGFRENPSANNSQVEIFPVQTLIKNSCAKHPIKVFESENANDMFTGQIGTQKWVAGVNLLSILQGQTVLPKDLHVDTSVPGAQALIYKSFFVFNDDTITCGMGNYTFKLMANGAELPLLTDNLAQYPSWGGPYYQTIFAYLPVAGLPYGPQHVTLEIKKENDGSVFTRDLIVNLVN
jgi:hypothetical protein